MIPVTFKIENVDYSALAATLDYGQTPAKTKILTTLDGTDHQYIGKLKSIVTVSFIPLTTRQLSTLYELLNTYTVYVTYLNPYIGDVVTQYMRVDGDLEAAFGLLSVDGNGYHTGLSITFRQL